MYIILSISFLLRILVALRLCFFYVVGLLGLVTGFNFAYRLIISREENTNLEKYISKYTSKFIVKYIPALFGGAIIGVTMGFLYYFLSGLLIFFFYFFDPEYH